MPTLTLCIADNVCLTHFIIRSLFLSIATKLNGGEGAETWTELPEVPSRGFSHLPPKEIYSTWGTLYYLKMSNINRKAQLMLLYRLHRLTCINGGYMLLFKTYYL